VNYEVLPNWLQFATLIPSEREVVRRSDNIRSFGELTIDKISTSRPVVTLFSGGLDSSYLLLRLLRAGFGNVHAVSVDLGEDETIERKRHIADKLGVRLHLIDGRQKLVDEYVRPAIAAQARYLDTHPISSSLSRPLIAQYAVEVAHELDASTVLHTATRSQNTLRRLNGAFHLLKFEGRYGSPYDLHPISREEKIDELVSHGLDIMGGRTESGDSNLWCREFESGVLDDPESHTVPASLYRWSVPTPGLPEESITVGFKGGVPISVDGQDFPLIETIGSLNRRVGAHGIGRYSGLEHLAGGEKVLEIREMPAAWLLLRSFRFLETAILDAETIREKMHLEQLWVREALEGRWFGELRKASQSFIESCAERITGTVRWNLTCGTGETRAITAESPRYLRDREAWEKSEVLDEIASYADLVGERR
jgi:argininosuccinate synthase